MTSVSGMSAGDRPAPGHLGCAATGRRATSGFSLIELLVVMGIIALLLGILVPSLVAGRREARKVLCQANLKQVGFGWRAYLDENRGLFPRSALIDINYGGRQGALPVYQVRKPVNKHLKLPLVAAQGAEVFNCPMDTGGGKDPNKQLIPDDLEISTSFFQHYGTSYLANPLLAGTTPYALGSTDPCEKSLGKLLATQLPGLNAGHFDHESKLVLVGDGVWQKAWNYSNKEPVLQWHGQARKYNIAFMDGHADFVEIRKGIHVSPHYTVMPRIDLQTAAAQCQAEAPAQ